MLGHSTALACFGLRRHGEGGPHSSLHRQRPENPIRRASESQNEPQKWEPQGWESV